jgi:hypothetical protein
MKNNPNPYNLLPKAIRWWRRKSPIRLSQFSIRGWLIGISRMVRRLRMTDVLCLDRIRYKYR